MISRKYLYSALAASFLIAGVAHGQVLYTNFGAGLAYDTVNRWDFSSGGGCSQNALAVQFTPSSTSLFGDAKLALANSPFAIGPNQVSVYLESDSAGSPGSIIEQLSATGLATFPASSVITVSSVSHPSLTAGTSYWLVLDTADPTTCDLWYQNSIGDDATTPTMQSSFSGSPTGPWQTTFQNGRARPAFQIDGFNVPDAYQISYAANLKSGPSTVNLTNASTLGGVEVVDDICANVYVLAQDQQLIECCTCTLTPNHLRTLSVQSDLIGNTLTPGVPSGVTIALLATQGGGACDAAAPGLAVSGLRAWQTTLHAAPGGKFAVTEFPFSNAVLSPTELAKLATFCSFIESNGSGFGVCNSCQDGAAGASKQ